MGVIFFFLTLNNVTFLSPQPSLGRASRWAFGLDCKFYITQLVYNELTHPSQLHLANPNQSNFNQASPIPAIHLQSN